MWRNNCIPKSFCLPHVVLCSYALRVLLLENCILYLGKEKGRFLQSLEKEVHNENKYLGMEGCEKVLLALMLAVGSDGACGGANHKP